MSISLIGRRKHLAVKRAERTGRTLGSNATSVLSACNEMLKQMQPESTAPGILVGLSSSDSSNALNWLFASDRICVMRKTITDTLNMYFRSSQHLLIKFVKRRTVWKLWPALWKLIIVNLGDEKITGEVVSWWEGGNSQDCNTRLPSDCSEELFRSSTVQLLYRKSLCVN